MDLRTILKGCTHPYWVKTKKVWCPYCGVAHHIGTPSELRILVSDCPVCAGVCDNAVVADAQLREILLHPSKIPRQELEHLVSV